MSATIDSLPNYLRQYCSSQDYAAYTPRDQASWRYIMRQSRAFFREHAVPIYVDGLRQTGIPLDRIPRVSEMDACLQNFGWGAVPVCGFIPPAAFLDFQARSILPIATGMRTVEHLAYTPAPDIVHEAAGHAPIIADPAYRAYLKRYSAMAEKAIFSADDVEVYEAIRYLSDIKENPDTEVAEVARAEARLEAATQLVTAVSEVTKVSRMAWWTIEYGLVGSLERPLIYGAGLLSSVGESQHCLSPAVRKIPLTAACVEQGYDITKPQPQLFVAPDLAALTEVLEDFEKTMAFVVGGRLAMDTAVRARSVNTIVLESGLEVSGQIAGYESARAAGGEAISFIKLQGPVQLAFMGRQLPGHGHERHGQGFSSPLGRWLPRPETEPTRFSDDELRAIGLVKGERAELKFISGFSVKGKVQGWTRGPAGQLLLITWADCTVTKGETRYFAPEWGEFDMAVGAEVVSVYGGPAAKADFGDYNMGTASTIPGRTLPFGAPERQLFELYGTLRQVRQGLVTKDELAKVARRYCADHPCEWLLGLELIETAKSLYKDGDPAWLADVGASLRHLRTSADDVTASLIDKGLGLAGEAD